jgi:hypothetical protein
MMKWVRRVAMTAISSAFVIGALATPTAAAPAASCQVEYVCLFHNGNFVNRLSEPIQPGRCTVIHTYFNQMINYERIWQRMWTGRNCTGTNSLVGPGEDSGIHMGTQYWSIGGY